LRQIHNPPAASRRGNGKASPWASSVRVTRGPLNESIEALGVNVNVLKSPLRSPKANSICERVIGTIRRECLDWLIPLSESRLRSILTSWVEHYNRGRPHSSLGPGVPDPPGILAMVQKVKSRHRLGEGVAVLAKSVLGGLHHEYSTGPSVG
jgi:putative transposase